MSYRELLQKYKEGTLSDSRKKEVEEDIEKQEAISDYLVDRMEEEWDAFSTVPAGKTEEARQEKEDREEAEKLTRMINRSIRRAFLKLGAAVTAISLVLVLFVVFGLSPLVSLFYYNPAKTVQEDRENAAVLNQMSRDYGIYSDVTMPGKFRDQVQVQSQGLGVYNIIISQSVSLSGKFENVSGTVRRGKLNLYNTNVLNPPSSFLFAASYSEDDSLSLSRRLEQDKKDLGKDEDLVYWQYSNQEEAREALENLEDDRFYQGYVTFENTMTFSELKAFLKTLPKDSWCEWYGVNTAKGRNTRLMGYYQYAAAACDTADRWKLDAYPDLNIWENTDSKQEKSVFDTAEARLQDESWCTTHMVSMLRYLSDQKQFLKLMGEGGLESNYKEAADYVEKNGLSFYGVLVIGKKADLLKLEAQKEVYGIVAQEAE